MRWSISALLAVMILSGAARGDEADAVKMVEQLGGTIKRDDKQPGKPVVAVDLSRTRVTDVELKELKELKALTKLDLHRANVTDAGVKDLQAALPKCKIER